MKYYLKNKRKFTVITLLFCMFILFYFCTVCYSAFSSTINISGMAHARIETDIRITDFSLYNVSDDTISSYEEFSKDSVLFNINFENDDSYVIYKVEVTNYSSREMGILDITGLQSYLSYELIDYNLKDKICNSSGICSGLITKEIYLKIKQTSNVYTGKSTDINLHFEFRPYIKVTYENLNYSNYPLELLYGDSLDIDISKDNPSINAVEVRCAEDITFSYNEGKLRVPFVVNDLTVIGGSSLEVYSYSGSYQTFTAPYPGLYKVELWGGSGGYVSSSGNNGRGGYTSGEITLNTGDTFYVYVGGKGGAVSGNSGAAGGYNGGGKCTTDCGGGGGATDIRLVSGTWNDFDSLKSRIMVAAGGGGENNFYYNEGTKKGGSAGGLEGLPAYGRNNSNVVVPGGTQIMGGITPIDTIDDSALGANGEFGIGGYAGLYGGGGGGGYYGGAGGANQPITAVDRIGTEVSGSGGSSFISGHAGCNAITSESTSSNIIHTGEEIHYSKYVFKDTVMVDGDGYSWTNVKGSSVVGMPNFAGNGTMTGNDDNGYAKISLISMYQELETDIKLTSFYKDSSNNAASFGERMTDTSFSADLSLPNESSYVTYKVQVTNYGSRKMGILNISGLPSNLSYELVDYNLKDMICNSDGKCNWGASKDFYIKIKYNSYVASKTNYHINLSFDFKPFYEVTYKNINKSSLVYNVFYNETLNVNIGYDVAPGVKFLRGNVLNDEFKYLNGNFTASNVLNDVIVEGFSINNEYDYTGNYQTFTVPCNGTYKIELWGGAGGHLSDRTNNGKGGYTSGEISLNKDSKFYVYVGGKGASTSSPGGGAAGGYNGGGNCTSQCGGGGGATDVRVVSGSWNDTSSLRSRIMVAAGGAGENNYTTSGELRGGSAGGLIGYDAYARNTTAVVVPGATQIKGGITPTGSCDGTALGANGSFGVGGAAGWYGGGGGSGYYGGAGGANQPKTATASDSGGEVSGSGGSSFISGHNGCDAINSSGGHTGQSIHYSNYKFTSTKMIDGNGYEWTDVKGSSVIGMPNFAGNGTMTGNNSTGYAKITLLGMTKE